MWPPAETSTITIEDLLDPPTGQEAGNPKYGKNATMRANLEKVNLQLSEKGIDMDDTLYVVDPHTSLKFYKNPTRPLL